MHLSNRPRSRGFTLVELLVVIGVATIILTSAVPTFSRTAQGYRMLGVANALARDLQFARSEAVKRGQNVTVCPSSDGQTCTTATTAWGTGWLVFFDANGNATVDAGDTLLRWQAQAPGTATFVADNNVGSLTFNRQGSISGLPANPVTLVLHEPTSNATLTRCVAVTPAGRSAVQGAGAGNCT